MREFFIFLCLFVIKWVFSAMTKINKYALICDFRGFEFFFVFILQFFFVFILQHNLLISRKKENKIHYSYCLNPHSLSSIIPRIGTHPYVKLMHGGEMRDSVTPAASKFEKSHLRRRCQMGA